MNKAKIKGDSVVTAKPAGRPRRGQEKVPYAEVDRLLVFGEVVPVEGGGPGTTVEYPSYRDLALRYGVSNSVIAEYAKKHKCLRRREVAQARIEAKVDSKMIEMRAEAIALSRDDELRIIDTYLAGFEKALADGAIRFDDPGHFDRLCRLKEFLQGGADSRQEVHAALSLENLQARHREMMKQVEVTSAAERGDVARALPAPATRSLADGSVSPTSQPAAAAEEATDRRSVGGVAGRYPRPVPEATGGAATARLAVAGQTERSVGADRGPTGAPEEGWDQDADDGDSTPHGANVAPTRPAPDDAGPPARPSWDEAEDDR